MKWYNLMSLPVVERSFVEETAAVTEVEVAGVVEIDLLGAKPFLPFCQVLLG